MERRRSKRYKIASAGRDLYNLLYENYNSPIQTNKYFCNLFTSDYDNLLQENNLNLKKASYNILSNLNNNLIPNYINNAIYNIIIDILYNNSKIRKKSDVVKMKNYYFDLAKNSFQMEDHNTTILIKCALEHLVIKRLNLKLRRSEKKLLLKLRNNYGNFIDCYKVHLKNIIENKNNLEKFIPSALVLEMHLKKNQSYLKAYTKLGEFPKKLERHSKKIESISKDIVKYYKEKNTKIIKLYIKNPFDNDFIKSTNYHELIGELLETIQQNYN